MLTMKDDDVLISIEAMVLTLALLRDATVTCLVAKAATLEESAI